MFVANYFNLMDSRYTRFHLFAKAYMNRYDSRALHVVSGYTFRHDTYSLRDRNEQRTKSLPVASARVRHGANVCRRLAARRELAAESKIGVIFAADQFLAFSALLADEVA